MSEHDRIDKIENELRELSSRRKALLNELRSLKGSRNQQKVYGSPLAITGTSSPQERIQIFLDLFRCRNDIYPKYWENQKIGKKGFSPACSHEWIPGLCEKPKIKCRDCRKQAFLPLDQTVAKNHLQGHEIIGTYAIKENNNCNFLAADFDKDSWRDDILAYKEAARNIGIEVALERSRSGNGGHAWIFFSEDIPASKARQLGTLVLSLSSMGRPNITLTSYDRFFPNQDILPKGGFGNLIALPLQRKARDKGNSIFIDESFAPIDNQWEYLAQIKRLSNSDIDVVLSRNLPKTTFGESEYDDFEIFNAETAIDVVVNKTKQEDLEEPIDIELSDQLYIDINHLSSKIISAFKRSATFANPEFFKLQKMRFSTWKTPRYIFCGEFVDDRLALPRGNLDFCKNLAEEVGTEVIVNDVRPHFKRIKIKFVGELRADQKKAVKQMAKHDFGVLVAPPGVGKTVMGCHMIGKRKVPTLILVHRKPLMDQWVNQISEFLNIDKKEIGSYGGTRKKPKGKVDVAMLQTVGNLEDANEFLSQYGQIIIDECHHIPAVSFENVLKKIPAKYFLGLTATPIRKDGLQAILHMQCGPIRYEMEEYGAKDLTKNVLIKETPFQLGHQFSEQVPIHEIWDHLIRDPKRLEMISHDVQECIEENAHPLIVSDRKEHLSLLSEIIGHRIGNKAEALLLIGGMGKKARKEVFDKVETYLREKQPFYILSTGSFIGEGIDIPVLDRLILGMPISFKSRLKQYVGRIHRPYDGKKEVKIYDYLDPNMGLTISMFKKRLKTFKDMGYEIESTVGSKANQLIYQRDLFSEFK